MNEARSADELGHEFIDAVNRRDADGLVALCHPEIELLPTALVGGRAVYHGHDGLRRWVAELTAASAAHEVRVRTVRRLGADRFAVLTEVCMEGEVVSPSAMVADLRDGLIVRRRT